MDVEELFTSKHIQNNITSLAMTLDACWVNTFSLVKWNPYNNVWQRKRPRGISTFCKQYICTPMRKKFKNLSSTCRFILSLCRKGTLHLMSDGEPGKETPQAYVLKSPPEDFALWAKTRKSFAINFKKVTTVAEASIYIYLRLRVFICVNHCGRESYWSENTKSFSLFAAWAALYYSHRLFFIIALRARVLRAAPS